MTHLTKRVSLTFSCAIAAFIASSSFAGDVHEGDVALTVSGNTIFTGEFEDDGSFHELRVFGSDFPGSGANFNFTDEPGFDNEPGTFPANSMVGFNILDSLSIWNGNGFDALDPNTEETMTLNNGALTAETDTGFVPGFGLSVSGDGSWHRHIGFTLNNVTAQDSGVYLLNLELWHDGGIDNSDSFWIVFNLNEDETVHDAAIDWVGANLVPAPGALALFGAIGLVARKRRRG